MNERLERIERLAERWFEGRTTDAEERELRELLVTTDDLPESLRDLAVLFEGFEELAGEQMPCGALDAEFALLPDEKTCRPIADAPDLPPETLRSQQPDLPAAPHASARSGCRVRLGWGLAAAAVVALGLFFGVELLREPYCYINGKPVYDKEAAMQATVYFDSFAVLEMPDQLVDELIQEP